MALDTKELQRDELVYKGLLPLIVAQNRYSYVMRGCSRSQKQVVSSGALCRTHGCNTIKAVGCAAITCSSTASSCIPLGNIFIAWPEGVRESHPFGPWPFMPRLILRGRDDGRAWPVRPCVGVDARLVVEDGGWCKNG